MREQAANYLRMALGNRNAHFRSGQWECIQALLERRKLLVVQRTGWGKSMIYFVAAKLLRNQSQGVTLLISPLLALMRNQIAAAQGLAIRAETVNSTNREDWDRIEGLLRDDHVDILLISPERLANDDFRSNVLERIVGRIGEELMADEGRALSIWDDAGWGALVRKGKYEDHHFDDQLVEACAQMIEQWRPDPSPTWVTCIPSNNHPELVPDFARRLASRLDRPFSSCVEKIKENRPQKEMDNSFHQANNLDGVFRINRELLRPGPVIVIDDMIDSGWTLTVMAALLRQAGCAHVYPIALSLTTTR
jgi:adenine/guanine phosphoribosyltransferase-like PRPP-binding protein